MTFNPQEFQKQMDSLEGKDKAGQEPICDAIKESFRQMKHEEREQAVALMNEHNQNHNTKLSINGSLQGNNFTVEAETNVKILGGAFGSRVQKSESQ